MTFQLEDKTMWPLFRSITINSTERGVLLRDGQVERILLPGRHRIPVAGPRTELRRYDVSRPLDKEDWVRALEARKPDLLEQHFLVVRPSEQEVGIVRLDGKVKYVVDPSGDVAFWQGFREVSAELVDVSGAPKLDRKAVNALAAVSPRFITRITVASGFEGLIYVDGELLDRLKPGVHAYWSAVRDVNLVTLDLRRQATEVTAQEILTQDRVSIRVTLTAFWQIMDTVKAGEAKDLNEQIYRHIQFAIRDAVANRTLDELLNARGEIDTELTTAVQSMGAFADFGVEIASVGLKDVILPGEMRDILNRVVEAEKQAQANLIRRREETAATRSLLNTSRLMENNPLLLRMKELETLEKLTEKVGRLDVSTSAPGHGLDGLLTNLVKLSDKAEA
ncbi:MAG: slipin family protein [Pseudomonadota bacterium]